ncbi:hypothetical protein GPECTOR_28g759 [Gonium pectorale]|uniref:dCMP deaminase n=1 Tax=Gonium pectorale TaxID=33097 RepID=A0A150GET9_GONPE|nr:hypothetical protein GPECTOR_28g759 [Gonium pectorale]|eukprot:KXZ48352.1 hypothetical protein GPECTOR_28g759 [Gonium pectorale]
MLPMPRADAAGSALAPLQSPLQALGRRDPTDPAPRSGSLSWDDYFMALAFLSAQRSKDPNKQVGAVIVNADNVILGIGYNGFPRGCCDSDLPWAKVATGPDGRPSPLGTKYPYVVHAEANALLNKNAASVAGARVYVTMFPCNECAKLLIQAGIREVVYHEADARPALATAPPCAGSPDDGCSSGAASVETEAAEAEAPLSCQQRRREEHLMLQLRQQEQQWGLVQEVEPQPELRQELGQEESQEQQREVRQAQGAEAARQELMEQEHLERQRGCGASQRPGQGRQAPTEGEQGLEGVELGSGGAAVATDTSGAAAASCASDGGAAFRAHAIFTPHSPTHEDGDEDGGSGDGNDDGDCDGAADRGTAGGRLQAATSGSHAVQTDGEDTEEGSCQDSASLASPASGGAGSVASASPASAAAIPEPRSATLPAAAPTDTHTASAAAASDTDADGAPWSGFWRQPGEGSPAASGLATHGSGPRAATSSPSSSAASSPARSTSGQILSSWARSEPGCAAARPSAAAAAGGADVTYLASLRLLRLAGVQLRQHRLTREVSIPGPGA